MNDKPVVHIIDDDNSVRDSLSILLISCGFQTKAYASGQEFLDACVPPNKGCVILDVHMPDMSGLQLQEILNERQINIPVIIITAYGDIPTAVKAMQLGAVDFIEKPYRESIIIEKVQSALQLADNIQEQEAAVAGFRKLITQLTSRERDVLKELVQGYSNKVIAANLGISPRTVEIHRAHIMDKLQLRSLAELIRFSIVTRLF